LLVDRGIDAQLPHQREVERVRLERRHVLHRHLAHARARVLVVGVARVDRLPVLDRAVALLWGAEDEVARGAGSGQRLRVRAVGRVDDETVAKRYSCPQAAPAGLDQSLAQRGLRAMLDPNRYAGQT
jgi:hypothetical protein